MVWGFPRFVAEKRFAGVAVLHGNIVAGSRSSNGDLAVTYSLHRQLTATQEFGGRSVR
jgi:hypothetical protein